ncbi:MAG: cell wall hydrolase [Lachnospiraceae bacterium]|nr:cell wall hydrolase [Lachnospiraceae bacterium]
MKLKSRKNVIGASIGAMLLAGVVIVGAAEHKTTDKGFENVSTINNNKSVMSMMEDDSEEAVVSIEPVTKDIVMGSVSDILAASDAQKMDASENANEQETEKTKSEYDDKFMTNIEECLNIRAAADENSDIVGKLYAGAGGTVLEKGDTWTKISSGSVEGYVATQYLLFGEDAKKKAEEVGTIKVTVKEDCIRVRKEPDENSQVIGLAESDKVYYANNVSADWIQIEFEDSLGYISSDYANAEFVIASAVSIEEELEQIRLEEEKKQEEQRRLEAEAAEEEEEEEVSYSNNQSSVETVITDSYDADVDDAYLLACLVEAEAGCEPYEGKLAVANVVLNRVNSSAFDNTIEGVIYARGQFSVVNNGSLSRALANGPGSDCVRAANEALSGVNNVPDYLFFRMTYIAEYSRYNSYTVIGSQVYYN